MLQKHLRKVLLLLIISMLLELTVFNYKAWFSFTAANQHPEVVQDGNTFYVTGMEGHPGYMYIGINHGTEEGELLPITFTVSVQDEGNANYYELTPVTLHSSIEKSKYLRLHSYGDVKSIKITVNADQASVWIADIIYDAKVPWFISLPRIAVIFIFLCLLWYLRPKSGFYTRQWTVSRKCLSVAMLLICHIGIFFLLVQSNPAFLDPVWPYHWQYQQLAESLSQGRVSIDAGDDVILEILSSMSNPYDYNLRMQTAVGMGNVWDICYYNGNFYVYFGIIPVLLFYLPYYLLFHSAFPTWLGVFLAGSAAVGGVYYLLGKIRSRWFSESPYGWYLIFSVIMSNSLNLFCAILHADFYYLPIVTALCFSLWGLGLIISAADDWNHNRGHVSLKLAVGSLCLALTAGCRPQFLVGSVLILPILLPLFKEMWQEQQKKLLIKRFTAIAMPYVFVALGLMYYNFIRFGSVLDFGANYNLTTNDMTRRGFELGRLPDGIFMYLFQPANIKLSFPFIDVTPFASDYLGHTIKDWTFGGAFRTRTILLSLLGLPAVKKMLKQKKLFGITAASMGMALLVIAADTEMSGILNRYYMDFLWLLMLPAVIVLFQMLENWHKTEAYKWILSFVLIAGSWGIFCELGMTFRGSGIMNDNAHFYYLVQSFFQ